MHFLTFYFIQVVNCERQYLKPLTEQLLKIFFLFCSTSVTITVHIFSNFCGISLVSKFDLMCTPITSEIKSCTVKTKLHKCGLSPHNMDWCGRISYIFTINTIICVHRRVFSECKKVILYFLRHIFQCNSLGIFHKTFFRC